MQNYNQGAYDAAPLQQSHHAQQPQGYVAAQPVPAGQPQQAPMTGFQQPQYHYGAGVPPPPNVAVRQKVELAEAILNFETQNEYKVLDAWGQVLFVCQEDSNCCVRQCLKTKHPFRMNMIDPYTGQVVISFHRPFRFIFDRIEVFDQSGQLLGYVRQRFTIFTREFDVFDHTDKPIFRIHGPLCHPWTFRLFVHGTKDQVGQITKKWSGFVKELFTDADNFGIDFPPQLTREFKAILVAATVLIDMCYFEQNQGLRGGYNYGQG